MYYCSKCLKLFCKEKFIIKRETCRNCQNKIWILKNKEIIKIKKRKYFINNREKFKEKAKEWALKNPEKNKEMRRKIRERSKIVNPDAKKKSIQKKPEFYKEQNRIYRKSKLAKYAQHAANRRALKKGATPKLLTLEQKQLIESIYINAKEKELLEGIKYNVDHIIPLKNELVCGLHVPWNLQILTEKENKSKNNRLYLTNETSNNLPQREEL